MRFELEADKWHFVLELEATPNYRPDNKFIQTPAADLQSWRDGSMGFYSLFITSFKKGDPDNSLTHYAAGLLLPHDPEEIQEDLEIILDDEGLFDHVLNHWKLLEENNGPNWRQS